MGVDLRIVFLFLLFVTAVIFVLRKGSILGAEELKQIILDFLLVPVAVGTVATFFFILTGTDPLPLLRQASYYLSFQQNISFSQAVPPNLQDNIEVVSVARHDTDGDDFSEWVVFYQFDLQSGRSPIQAVIYDSDRGNPPVIFPYQLRAPGRDYLGENISSLDFDIAQITKDQNGPDHTDLPEILVSDNNQLTIFRYRKNSEEWDFPRDDPPRYSPVGFFRGSGGVTLDETTKKVTVIDRDKFERSQLSVRSIYALNQNTNSYWDGLDPIGVERETNPALAAPIVSTIDFFSDPPQDILETAFPEKIALAFYASTCGVKDDTLCRNDSAGWEPVNFLEADALAEYKNDNAGYFGLSSFNNMRNVSISSLSYHPSLESDPDLLETGAGRDVVTGEQAQFNIVDITFVAGEAPLETARYEMGLVGGRWKILRRVPLEPLALESPTQIPAQSE